MFKDMDRLWLQNMGREWEREKIAVLKGAKTVLSRDQKNKPQVQNSPFLNMVNMKIED